MSLSHGREMVAIPGPSVMPDRVLNAMHRAAPNIYSGALVDMTASLVPDLRAVARTEGNVAMYIGNGHAAWEASVANALKPGDKALVPATGMFAHGWGAMAERLGIQCEILEFGKRAPVDPEAVRARLAEDKNHEIKAILMVHVDTSSSALSDFPAVRKVLDELNHPALLFADCIASLAVDRFEMDEWGVDVMIAGSQKGLMVPPGMCFIFFNERAAASQNPGVSSYWDWAPRAAPEDYYLYWCGTAPTHHTYGLREALDMIVHEEGLEAIWARHEKLAGAVWAAVDAWGADGPMELNIADPVARSRAVTAIRIGKPYGTDLRNWLEAETGVILGVGLGMATKEDPEAQGFFRIGHMGHLNAHMLLGTLGAIDAGLKALSIPHGSGALEAATKVCSGQG